MAEILKFLGVIPSAILNTNHLTPNSILILIGSQSSFIITDQDGNVKQDKNGMIALINPERSSYKIKVLPRSNNTLFIVAQFLPNDKILYKEYHMDGFAPKFKTARFDPNNPLEDILN
jgi:hypothetical protein